MATDLQAFCAENHYDSHHRDLDLATVALSKLEFEGCTFDHCVFKEATLDKCSFVDCQFIECDLSLIRLGFSKFVDVSFRDSKLLGVNWTEATWSSILSHAPVSFLRCTLNDSSFYGLQMREAEVAQCLAHHADFREADFADADFRGTEFQGALFGNTRLGRADFAEAIDFNIDVRSNEVTGAKFSRLEATSLLAGLGIEIVD
jgi:uncharacterized protein YjbI with pentapeptide repeats